MAKTALEIPNQGLAMGDYLLGWKSRGRPARPLIGADGCFYPTKIEFPDGSVLSSALSLDSKAYIPPAPSSALYDAVITLDGGDF